MKEIKLRIWDKTYKRFYYMVITKDNIANTMNPNAPVGELAEWEQCSGLKDINGKEIYEGDILKSVLYRLGRKGTQISIIRFHAGQFCAECISADSPDFAHFTPLKGMQNFNWSLLSESIGNIHENPELMEKLNKAEAIAGRKSGKTNAATTILTSHDPREEV